jgi:hypothetical protein
VHVKTLIVLTPIFSAAETKAKGAKKAALQGTHGTAQRKKHYSVTFRRPKTLRLARKPKYLRKSIPHAPRMDEFRTIISCASFTIRSLHLKTDSLFFKKMLTR